MPRRLYKPPARIIETVRMLIDALEKEGVSVDEAYLFGSYARGDYLKSSDIDLVIVSKSFRGIRYIDRLETVYRVEWMLRLRPWIEVIPLTPEELSLRVKDSFALRDASRYWIKVK